jgi:HTH-type transcriptional regulator, sugar sensing transcriptional regulator
VLTKPSWTSVIFDHTGFAEGMSGLFENYWALGSKHQPASLEANAG